MKGIASDIIYARKMNKILKEIEFIRKQELAFYSLSTRELQIAALIYSGNTISQISHMLKLSKNTINNQKQSLKKKINAKTDADIVRFASAFEIIFENETKSLT